MKLRSLNCLSISTAAVAVLLCLHLVPAAADSGTQNACTFTPTTGCRLLPQLLEARESPQNTSRTYQLATRCIRNGLGEACHDGTLPSADCLASSSLLHCLVQGSSRMQPDMYRTFTVLMHQVIPDMEGLLRGFDQALAANSSSTPGDHGEASADDNRRRLKQQQQQGSERLGGDDTAEEEQQPSPRAPALPPPLQWRRYGDIAPFDAASGVIPHSAGPTLQLLVEAQLTHMRPLQALLETAHQHILATVELLRLAAVREAPPPSENNLNGSSNIDGGTSGMDIKGGRMIMDLQARLLLTQSLQALMVDLQAMVLDFQAKADSGRMNSTGAARLLESAYGAVCQADLAARGLAAELPAQSLAAQLHVLLTNLRWLLTEGAIMAGRRSNTQAVVIADALVTLVGDTLYELVSSSLLNFDDGPAGKRATIMAPPPPPSSLAALLAAAGAASGGGATAATAQQLFSMRMAAAFDGASSLLLLGDDGDAGGSGRLLAGHSAARRTSSMLQQALTTALSVIHDQQQQQGAAAATSAAAPNQDGPPAGTTVTRKLSSAELAAVVVDGLADAHLLQARQQGLAAAASLTASNGSNGDGIFYVPGQCSGVPLDLHRMLRRLCDLLSDATLFAHAMMSATWQRSTPHQQATFLRYLFWDMKALVLAVARYDAQIALQQSSEQQNAAAAPWMTTTTTRIVNGSSGGSSFPQLSEQQLQLLNRTFELAYDIRHCLQEPPAAAPDANATDSAGCADAQLLMDDFSRLIRDAGVIASAGSGSSDGSSSESGNLQPQDQGGGDNSNTTFSSQPRTDGDEERFLAAIIRSLVGSASQCWPVRLKNDCQAMQGCMWAWMPLPSSLTQQTPPADADGGGGGDGSSGSEASKEQTIKRQANGQLLLGYCEVSDQHAAGLLLHPGVLQPAAAGSDWARVRLQHSTCSLLAYKQACQLQAACEWLPQGANATDGAASAGADDRAGSPSAGLCTISDEVLYDAATNATAHSSGDVSRLAGFPTVLEACWRQQDAASCDSVWADTASLSILSAPPPPWEAPEPATPASPAAPLPPLQRPPAPPGQPASPRQQPLPKDPQAPPSPSQNAAVAPSLPSLPPPSLLQEPTPLPPLPGAPVAGIGQSIGNGEEQGSEPSAPKQSVSREKLVAVTAGAAAAGSALLLAVTTCWVVAWRRRQQRQQPRRCKGGKRRGMRRPAPADAPGSNHSAAQPDTRTAAATAGPAGLVRDSFSDLRCPAALQSVILEVVMDNADAHGTRRSTATAGDIAAFSDPRCLSPNLRNTSDASLRTITLSLEDLRRDSQCSSQQDYLSCASIPTSSLATNSSRHDSVRTTLLAPGMPRSDARTAASSCEAD